MRASVKFLMRSTALCSAAALTAAMAASSAYAQTSGAAADGEDAERIVVTGSRIARDTFTSPSPLQTYDIDAAQQIGVTSISELLQRSTVANGTQVDRTLNTNAGNSNAAEPPPLGGVGSANIGLRGLDPERTLVLVNGRRMGVAGVRGAPAQPDLNLLPLSLVQSVEVATEGASAIYGADAVAGVVNVILDDDFEGLQLQANFELPEAPGGDVKQFSFKTGAATDRANIVFGGEYFEQRRVLLGDRIDCRLAIGRTTGGDTLRECSNGFFDNSVFTGGLPGDPSGDVFVWYFPNTPAANSDIGVRNFGSSFSLPNNTEFDGECQRADNRCYNFDPVYSDEGDRLRSDLVQPITRFSLVSLGSYDLDLWGENQEMYFEAYYFNRTADNKAAPEQIFPTVLAQIPQLDANGNVVVDGMGNPILVDNPLNPFDQDVVPIVTLEDFRSQDRDVELSQVRFVGGLRGDLPTDTTFGKDWSYDVFFSYDRGVGFQSQPLMNELNLQLSQQTLVQNSDGSLSCGVPLNSIFGFITPQACVPVNFFADSIYEGGPNGDGVFETTAERDFLIGQRLNRTVTEQFVFSGYVSGELFELPLGGMAQAAFGGEWRSDRINSQADMLSATGGNAGENPLTEQPTIGDRRFSEIYGEVFLPLIEDQPYINSLTLEGAVRRTKESNFGSEATYRVRGAYSPIDWITMAGSWGTSFRAPNLREQFLAPQQAGTSSANDPCTIPAAANIASTYVPANDTRSQTVLDNCFANGADPTMLGLTATINVPVTLGGNVADLQPETSEAFTATLLVSPPVRDYGMPFDLDVSASFFNITVKDNIRSLDPTIIMDRCFESPGLSSPLCDRLQRDLNRGDRFNFISFIDASFVNVGEEKSQGLDLNTRLSTTFEDPTGLDLGAFDFIWNTAVTFQTKRTEQIFEDDPVDNLRGDHGTPKTRLNSSFLVTKGRTDVLFNVRWFGSTTSSTDFRANAQNCDTPSVSTNFPGSPELFSICDAESRTYIDAAITHRLLDNVAFTFGVNNMFDKQPPLISTGAGPNRGNRVTSSGYDQIGRSYFINLVSSF